MTRTSTTPNSLHSDSLSQLFFSGDYEALLRTAASHDAAMHHPAVIGALAMVGRVEDAEMAAASAIDRYESLEDLALYRFFMVMGYCHNGRYDEARSLAAKNLTMTRNGAPFVRFLGNQSAALVHYFSGQMLQAQRSAKRAHAAALASSVPYARLLALDLSGHVAVQLGQLRRGIRALRDGEELADELGFAANAQTARTSHMVYALRLPSSKRNDAAGALEALVSSDQVSRFAKRNGLLSLALLEAIRGNCDRAHDLWNDVRELSLESEDARGSARVTMVGAAIAAIQGDHERSESLWQSLRGRKESVSLDIEIAYLRALLGLPIDTAAVAALFAATSIERARSALVLCGQIEPDSNLDWPAIARLPGVVDSARQLLDCEANGLLPFALGVSPSTRVHVHETSWIIESHGNVTVNETVSARAAEMLSVLADGPATKAALLSRVWGISGYNPALHDGTIQKTVSRLRKSLSPFPEWIVTDDDGYALKPGVELVVGNSLISAANDGNAEEVAKRSQSPAQRALWAARSLRVFSCIDLAGRLSVSPATALRLLRSLVEQGAVTRQGRGKNTRYYAPQLE